MAITPLNHLTSDNTNLSNVQCNDMIMRPNLDFVKRLPLALADYDRIITANYKTQQLLAKYLVLFSYLFLFHECFLLCITVRSTTIEYTIGI